MSRRGFLIGISVVLVIALALVLYFAFFAGGRDAADPAVDAAPEEQASGLDRGSVGDPGAAAGGSAPVHLARHPHLSGGRWMTSSI
jgi:hypothetical protein